MYQEQDNTQNSERKERCNIRPLLIYNKISFQFILKVAGTNFLHAVFPIDLYQDF